MSGRTARLVVLGGLFAGWVGWLAWQTRSAHGVVLSRAQLAASTSQVVADVAADPGGLPSRKLANVEHVGGEKVEAGEIDNLAECRGYQGPGRYLLMLAAAPRGGFRVAPVPRSPGMKEEFRPLVYPWGDDVRRQFEELVR